jgi:hypothetical protein
MNLDPLWYIAIAFYTVSLLGASYLAVEFARRKIHKLRNIRRGWRRDRLGWYWVRETPGEKWKTSEYLGTQDGFQQWSGCWQTPAEVGPHIPYPSHREDEE